jgi:hypothetical protein
MAKIFPIMPAHPERICWGCDLYCPADDMACGNGSSRTQHPSELFGEGWQDWGLNANDKKQDAGHTGAAAGPPPAPKPGSTG